MNIVPLEFGGGVYSVSSDGTVLRRETYRGTPCNREVRGSVDRYGKRCVFLASGGKTKCVYLHQLVAQTFVPNPHGYTQVKHLDCNPSNNRADNLAWVQQKYTAPNRSIPARAVKGVHRTSGAVVTFKSIAAAAKEGFIQQNISACCLGKQAHHAGYVWTYTDE